jgi:methylamine dehydrogenase accessory protein MauD
MPVGWAIVVIIQWLAIIALAIVVLGVLRQVSPRLERAAARPARDPRLQGPAVGSKLPAFAARNGSLAGIGGPELDGRPGVLLFLSAGCRPCQSLIKELGSAAAAGLASCLTVVCAPEDVTVVAFPAWLHVLTMPNAECSETLRITLRPFAVAVDADGIVQGKQVLNTLAQLTDLTATVLPDLPVNVPGGGPGR